MAAPVHLTGVERTFADDEIIVSKTDPKGRMTYCNDIFLRLAGYSESELIGQPHSMIRHPHMPRCVFKLLWSRIQSGTEVFAYVINRSGNGDHYWVLAHVTPDLVQDGAIIGFHSNRRPQGRTRGQFGAVAGHFGAKGDWVKNHWFAPQEVKAPKLANLNFYAPPP